MDSKAATEREVARIKKQIDDVDKEIKQLAQGIAAAEEEWIKGGSESDRKYWQEKGLLLVKEKGDFQKEKARLLKKEQELREWMLGITPTASAVRRGPYGEAGTCTDLEMQDVDHGDTDYAGPLASGGPAGRGQQRGDRFRSSGENPWSTEVDLEVRKVLESAFVSQQRNGQPQLDERPPPPDNPLARQDASTVYFRDSPSLLLTSLPGQKERGLTNAQKLLAVNKQLHASGRGQHQVQTRVTTLIGPSGAGKTRTALEALCHEYGFYMSFSTEKEPGTLLLREAIQRLRTKHKAVYKAAKEDAVRLQEFRQDRLDEMGKFITRILLAYALGLREYLGQHGDYASPGGFLLFQLIGLGGQEDWLVNTWDCLLALSSAAVEQKLADTMAGIMAELQVRTGQTFVNIFLDEAQVGTRELDGFFPNRDNSAGRSLLNAWVRSLHQRAFAPFHFNLTGTGLSLRHAQQLETAVGEMGAAQLSTFTDFTRFSLDAALEYAQVYLQSPPKNVKVHILVGRPRFAAQLVQAVLLLGKSWEEALQFVEELHTRQDVPTSLLKGLHEAKAKLSGRDFTVLVEELQNLVLGYYIIGRGVPTDKWSVDMIEVGVCHLAYVGRPGECTMVTLVEPLAAMAATNFLATEAHWLLDTKQLNMIRLSPSDSAMGALFERIIPRAQLRLLTRDCLDTHPLFKDIKDLPACFRGRARMECLLGQGDKICELTLEDRLHVEAWRPGRGLLDFLREPNGTASYFPEEGAGPDNGSFLRIADKRWLPIVQAKCRKKVPNKAHALGSLELRTMFKGERDPESKRQQFKELLRQRGVTGILQILLAYPADVDVSSFAKSSLRRSPRFQQSEEDEFDFVQVCISRSNAEHYLLPEERCHLDCLKDV